MLETRVSAVSARITASERALAVSAEAIGTEAARADPRVTSSTTSATSRPTPSRGAQARRRDAERGTPDLHEHPVGALGGHGVDQLAPDVVGDVLAVHCQLDVDQGGGAGGAERAGDRGVVRVRDVGQRP